MKKREIKSKIKKLFEAELADMETQDAEGGEISAKELGDSIGVNWEEVDEEQFAQGIEVEKEHMETVGGDMEIIAKIALDHLKELPDYYTKLAEMEGGEEAPAEEVPAEEPVKEPTEEPVADEVPAEDEPKPIQEKKNKK